MAKKKTFWLKISQIKSNKMKLCRRIILPCAFSLFNITFAIWHLPILYELTLKFHAIHIIEHLTFLITSTILWWPILAPIQRFRLNYPMQIGYIFLITKIYITIFFLYRLVEIYIYQIYAGCETYKIKIIYSLKFQINFIRTYP